ncbi:MAG: mycofactocin-associated electron transfer flavoprotein alpha subunit [Ilumatobacteraceae bacterium]
MLAVVVVRGGELPAGGDETVAECGGRALLIGSATADAADALTGIATEVRTVDADELRPAAWARQLAAVLADEPAIVLPSSADGRDLAPRLAAVLERPLLANAASIAADGIDLIRNGGQELLRVLVPERFVATLHPGLRGVVRDAGAPPPTVTTLDVPAPAAEVDADVIATLPADAATVDLAEAGRIVGGGAGLDGAPRFEQLAALGAAIGASVGATRVITDRGWVGHDRQIGTTGVVVDPQLYLAFGISGAVQHTSGLGDPAHVVSVNTDGHCPMMQLADLAITADANATLDELLALLSEAP